MQDIPRTNKKPLVKGQRVMVGGKIATVEKYFPQTSSLMAAVKLKEFSRLVYLSEIQS